MPHVSRNAHVGHSEERLIRDLHNLKAVAMLEFHVFYQMLNRATQRLFLVEPEHCGLDLPCQEEEGPTFLLNSLFERGTVI